MQHMLDAASKAARGAAGRNRKELAADDDLLVDGLVRLICVIGEAAKNVSEATQSELKDIPWSPLARMRDRLIHAYFDVDLDTLWATVQDDLPSLIQALESALAAASEG